MSATPDDIAAADVTGAEPTGEATGEATPPTGRGLRGPSPIGRITSLVLLVAGVIGLIASSTLTIERVNILLDPSYKPSCSINPVLSCGSVMVTDQAAIFGFPNPLIGIAAYSVIVVTGLLSLVGIGLPRWYWLGQSLCTAAGFVMLNWLAFESIYRINALCPYCMVVWAITPIILFISIGRLFGTGHRAREARAWLWMLVPAWYAVVIIAIAVHFWYYWQTLF